MTIRIPVAARNAMLDTLVDRADAGAGPATLKVYSGGQPATADTAATGTLLVTFTLADPAFEAAASNAVAIDADPDINATAVATGTAGWARLADSDGVTVFDGTVGTSGTDWIINSTSITLGQIVVLTSGQLTL